MKLFSSLLHFPKDSIFNKKYQLCSNNAAFSDCIYIQIQVVQITLIYLNLILLINLIFSTESKLSE